VEKTKGEHSVLAFLLQKALPMEPEIRDSDALEGAGKSRPTRPKRMLLLGLPEFRTVPASRACRDQSRTCQKPSPRHGGGLGA